MRKHNYWSLIKPSYFLSWCGIFILWLAIKLPYSWQIKMGCGVGLLLPRLSAKRKHRVEINLKLCFPDFSEEQRADLLKKNFQSVGISLFETAMACWASDRRLRKLLHKENKDIFSEFKKIDKPILMISPHFTTLHIVGRLIAMTGDFAVMYNKHKHPVLESVSQKALSHYHHAIARSDLRNLLRSLRKKIPTWYAADTNSGKRDTVIAPFFDIPIETLTSTARIAALSKAVVVPTYFYRRDDNKGYNIVLGAPLENFPTKDAIADAHRVNQALEIGIRKMPEQYFWQYRRFKLPSHLADPYRL